MSWLVAFIIRTLILAGAVWVAATLVPGIQVGDWPDLLAVALILGLLNALLRPFLVIISIPLLVLTLGLFLIVINALLLLLTEWVAGWFEGLEFTVDGFGAALLGAVIISIVTFIVSRFVSADRIARSVAR
jgi:putative membrane protein